MDPKNTIAVALENLKKEVDDNLEGGYVLCTDDLHQSAGDVIDAAMAGLFGQNWEEIDAAVAFYENIACDMRADAEQEIKEKHLS